MSKNLKIIIISIVILSMGVGLLYYFGIRPKTTNQIIQETKESIEKISEETKDSIGFPDEPSQTGNEVNYQEISLEPLVIGTTSSSEVLQIDIEDLDTVYNQKISIQGEPSSVSDLPFIRADIEDNTAIILFQELKTKNIYIPEKLVSDLYEFDYRGVKYWVYKEPAKNSLFISLENFQNPKEVLIKGNPLNVFSIKPTKNQSELFYLSTAGDDGNTKLAALDFGKIPFDRWTNLDFLDVKIDSVKLENTVDSQKLNLEIEKSLQDNTDTEDFGEYYTEYTGFNFYPVENGKVLLQAPGVVNQFWLVDDSKTSLIKLDATFDSGDGFITCKQLDNICVVYYRNVGLYKLDFGSDQPVATNVEVKIKDKGDGVFDANFIRSLESLGGDSQKLLKYDNNQVIFWYEGGKFILGEFDK
jgi:hypothetical protein